MNFIAGFLPAAPHASRLTGNREATIDSVFTPWNPPSSQWDTDFTDFTDQADHRRMESDPLAHAINVSELIHAVEAPSRLKEIIRVHP
jgi:hypothetical protein